MDSASTPRNFATHAIECFRDYLLKHEKSAVKDDMIETRMKEALYWLDKSVKFIGPVNGEFLDRLDMISEDVDYPKLPFDAICIEYEYEVTDVSSFDGVYRAAREEQPDRACVLAFYSDPSTPLGQLIEKDYGDASHGEFVVWPILGFRAGRTVMGHFVDKESWIPVLDPVLITRENRSALNVEIRLVDSDKKIAVQVLACKETLATRMYTNERLGRDASPRTVLKEMTNDAAAEAMSVVELCNLLECTNIETEAIEAPFKLNKKRLAAGKAPFFEYKVLKIKGTTQREREPGGTAHASPRLHYRRGHIRRLASGKKTWVRPHMVGDASRGHIVKDYAPVPKDKG